MAGKPDIHLIFSVQSTVLDGSWGWGKGTEHGQE